MQRREPQRRLWPWLSLLVASLGVVGVIAWDVWPYLQRTGEAAKGPLVSPQPAARPIPGDRRRVRLFFPQEPGNTLREQEREIPRRPNLAEEVRTVLQELSSGRSASVRPPLPPGIEVRQLLLDGFGILYLDFGKDVQAVLAAPGEQAELAISALVTTLTTSFTEIKRVQFLVEGQEITAMAGAMDLRRPLSPRFPGEAGPTIITQPQE